MRLGDYSVVSRKADKLIQSRKPRFFLIVIPEFKVLECCGKTGSGLEVGGVEVGGSGYHEVND